MEMQRRAWLFVCLLSFAACKGEGGGTGGPLPPEEPCAEGQARCGAACVSIDHDPLHCGGCNKVCAEDATCLDGRCHPRCGSGEIFCDGRCVNPDEDRDNCGGCGLPCTEAEICEAGECTPVCPPAASLCGEECVYLQSDPSHCGACGAACGADEACVNGACKALCDEGQTLCGGRCVTLATSRQHCGACNNTCGQGERCNEGQCVLVCEAWEESCGSTCVDTRSSVAHCGGCARACESRPHAVLFWDGGSCGFSCEPGRLDCDGDGSNGCEVDANKAIAHCGACDNDCRTMPRVVDAACQFGVCVPTSCEDGWAHCGGDEAGCETYLIDNPEHCGACGRACDALPNTIDTSCEGTACTFGCLSGWDDCDGDWTNGCEQRLDDDPLHCGGCGVACGDLQVCQEGTCTAREFATWPVQAIDASRYLVDEGAETTIDLVTGRMWERRVHPLPFTWSEAHDHCQTLARGGHTDWRLPTRIELLSIVHRSAEGDLPIDTQAFPSTPKMFFWTSSPVAGQPTHYWTVGFQFGSTGLQNEKGVARVRCVRGDGSPPPAQRFEPSGKIVRDLWTGLDWERESSSTYFSFDDAAAHCAGLSLEHESGWRVPTGAELESILDVRVPNPGPTLDATVFLNTHPSTYWAWEPNGIFGYWWGVDFKSGGIDSYKGLQTDLPVRCVKPRSPLKTPSQ